MDSLDNVRERIEALEQRTEQLQQHTCMVERRVRWWRGIACGLLIVGLASLPLPVGTAKEDDKERKDDALERRVKMLEAKLAAVTFDSSNYEIVITGANLRIVNDLGTTDTTNGLGNLIVGYNEMSEFRPANRTGSHNVVVGKAHNFSSFGGLVVGLHNEISGQNASVSGGQFNTASGDSSSVSGGGNNIASGSSSSVSGGAVNTASGDSSSVSGGSENTASGFGSAVSGGFLNTASEVSSAVSGGGGNRASGFGSAVSGGGNNIASGGSSAVSGGDNNTASGDLSSVSGGTNRSAPGTENWAAGSLLEPN